jgi:hypothetical protein
VADESNPLNRFHKLLKHEDWKNRPQELAVLVAAECIMAELGDISNKVAQLSGQINSLRPILSPGVKPVQP